MALVQHIAALKPAAAPVCSVCIANYNGVGVLADCLDSVLAQQGDIPVEIIVHDDASSDDSVAWIRQRYPNVELLASSENVGFCVSNNRMVAHARGEFVLLLNNDAAFFPDALLTLLTAARAEASPGILTLPQFDWQSGELVDRGCLLDPFYNPVPNLDPAQIDVASVIGACLFLPRNLWNELGGFPDWMESIGEDIYLCCLARLRGAAVRVPPASGFRHRLGASFGGARVTNRKLSTTLRRRKLSERNKTFVLFVCTPTRAMWVVLAIHVFFLLLEGIAVSLLRLDGRLFVDVYMNVPRSLWQDRKRLAPLRKQVQEARAISMRTYFKPFTWLPRKLMMLIRFGVPKVAR